MNTRFKLLALALGLLIALAGVEVGLRILGIGYGNSPIESDPVLHHVHPRNYTFVQHHPSGELGGFAITYNSEGRVFSGTAAAGSGTPGPCRIAFMGDSFTEAGQVPYAESFVGKLEAAARAGCEVRNYGVKSYSPAIYLVQWSHEIRQWKPTYVFLLLFGNDVSDDLEYMKSAVIGGDGFPTAIKGEEGGWITAQLRRSYLARFVRMVSLSLLWAWEHRGEDQRRIGGVVEENPKWGTPTTDLLIALAQRVNADGAELVIMAVPSRFRLMGEAKTDVAEDLDRRIKGWAEANGLRFLDLHPDFHRASKPDAPLFFRQDIHFSTLGHAVTADVIRRAFPQLFQ